MGAINIIIIILMVVILTVAISGFVQIIFKDKSGGKRSNRLMVIRVALQAVVIIIIGVIYFFSNRI